MGDIWKEVERPGRAGLGYPHVLAEAHGWCLRLRPRRRCDDKYYSSLPGLLRGLLEHRVRRRLMAGGGGLDLEGFVREVRGALDSAHPLGCRALRKGYLEVPPRQAGARGRREKGQWKVPPDPRPSERREGRCDKPRSIEGRNPHACGAGAFRFPPLPCLHGLPMDQDGGAPGREGGFGAFAGHLPDPRGGLGPEGRGGSGGSRQDPPNFS